MRHSHENYMHHMQKAGPGYNGQLSEPSTPTRQEKDPERTINGFGHPTLQPGSFLHKVHASQLDPAPMSPSRRAGRVHSSQPSALASDLANLQRRLADQQLGSGGRGGRRSGRHNIQDLLVEEPGEQGVSSADTAWGQPKVMLPKQLKYVALHDELGLWAGHRMNKKEQELDQKIDVSGH